MLCLNHGMMLSITDGPSLDVLGILRKLQNVGFCLDLGESVNVPFDCSKEKLSSLFDQILSGFLKEIYQKKQEIRPLPPMLGDGRSVDLFKLYWVVSEKGGYDSVTANGSWTSVSEEIGLDSAVGPSLKLIYVKYLDTLDRWLQKVLEKKVAEGVRERKDDWGSLVGELEMEVKGFFHEIPDQRKKGGLFTPLLGSKRHHFLTPVRGRELHYVDDESDNDDVMVLDPDVANVKFSSHKRKREALVGMLNWVISVAKNPCDPSVGELSLDESKVKDHAVGEFFSQAVRARQAMFLKKTPCTNTDGSLSQKRQKMHPSIYEDCIGADTQTNENLRSSQRFHFLNKQSHSGSSSEAFTVSDDDWDKGLMAQPAEGCHDKRRLRSANLYSEVVSRDQQQKRVPVGPSFQAKVPDWTGMSSVNSDDSDDLKWLGTRIWPPERKENKRVIESNPIGKGRRYTCGCEHPGSVECVRFHVAEKRLQLKCELGSAFHCWRLDRMGEEVALSWTEEEERKFKAIVRLNPPSLNKSFWDQMYLCFPSKTRQNLVSYYFNVFLLKRRSYQNRVTPSNIDSDDEETESGFLSSPFGRYAPKVRDPKGILCAQNVQCVDLEERTDLD